MCDKQNTNPTPPVEETVPQTRRSSSSILLGACVVLFVIGLLIPALIILFHPEVPRGTEDNGTKDGLVWDADGEIRYYVDDQPTAPGLIQTDEGYYYYISGASFTAVRNITRHIAATNGLLPEGTYSFGEDGRMLMTYIPDTSAPDTDTPDTDTPDTDTPDTTPPPEESDEPNDKIDSFDPVTVSLKLPDANFILVTDEIYNFLSMDIRDEQHVTKRPGEIINPTVRMDSQRPLTIEITDIKNATLADCKIELAYDAEFTNIVETRLLPKDQTSATFTHLYANTEYFYRITVYTNEGDVIVTTPSPIKTADTPRVLSVEGLYQVRDIGNWKTVDGKRIKQGLLIRGTELDGAVESRYHLTNDALYDMLTVFGIKTDLDLREPQYPKVDSLGSRVQHKYYDMVMYSAIFSDRGKQKIREIFADLANPEIYPVYLHCTYGCDRTGTVCYLLEALLGVSRDDCLREYSLSNLYLKNILTVEQGLAIYDGTLQQQTEAYLRSCGVTQAQIESIKNIFLGD